MQPSGSTRPCGVQVLMASGMVAPDHFEWRKVKPYLLYVGMFVATIYANMRALQHSNVETIIVFRAVRVARGAGPSHGGGQRSEHERGEKE